MILGAGKVCWLFWYGGCHVFLGGNYCGRCLWCLFRSNFIVGGGSRNGHNFDIVDRTGGTTIMFVRRQFLIRKEQDIQLFRINARTLFQWCNGRIGKLYRPFFWFRSAIILISVIPNLLLQLLFGTISLYWFFHNLWVNGMTVIIDSIYCATTIKVGMFHISVIYVQRISCPNRTEGSPRCQSTHLLIIFIIVRFIIIVIAIGHGRGIIDSSSSRSWWCAL